MNYIAKNIDVDKILEALSKQREYAREQHIKNVEKEEARYNQEIADIICFENMFKCSNYEKTEKDGVGNVTDN